MNKLRELRKARGITQQELGDALNVTQTAVARWENGCNGICRKYYKPLAKVLSITVEEAESLFKE